MKTLIFRVRNFIFRKLLLSNDNRVVLKPGPLLLALLIALATLFSFIELTRRTSMKKVFEYDLMLDIMNSQNISNRKIMCPVKKLNDSFNQNQMFIKKYYLNLDHVNKHDSNSEGKFVGNSYSMNLTDTRKQEE